MSPRPDWPVIRIPSIFVGLDGSLVFLVLFGTVVVQCEPLSTTMANTSAGVVLVLVLELRTHEGERVVSRLRTMLIEQVGV